MIEPLDIPSPVYDAEMPTCLEPCGRAAQGFTVGAISLRLGLRAMLSVLIIGLGVGCQPQGADIFVNGSSESISLTYSIPKVRGGGTNDGRWLCMIDTLAPEIGVIPRSAASYLAYYKEDWKPAQHVRIDADRCEISYTVDPLRATRIVTRGIGGAFDPTNNNTRTEVPPLQYLQVTSRLGQIRWEGWEAVRLFKQVRPNVYRFAYI